VPWSIEERSKSVLNSNDDEKRKKENAMGTGFRVVISRKRLKKGAAGGDRGSLHNGKMNSNQKGGKGGRLHWRRVVR